MTFAEYHWQQMRLLTGKCLLNKKDCFKVFAVLLFIEKIIEILGYVANLYSVKNGLRDCIDRLLHIQTRKVRFFMDEAKMSLIKKGSS